MRSRAVARVMLALLLTSMFVLAFNVHSVEAVGTIYIRADGSVDPSTAPILQEGDMYTLTDNISNSIVIEKDNIVFDGAGHTVQGTGDLGSVGIRLDVRNNVTVKNAQIRNFQRGIWLSSSVYSNISGNKIDSRPYGSSGIDIDSSSDYNTIGGNNITGNNHGTGVNLASSSNNSIKRNEINNYSWGICLERTYLGPLTKNNNVSENNVANVVIGIDLSSAVYNSISRNDITASSQAGIRVWGLSNYNGISENSITASNRFGMHIYYAFSNNISGNAFINSGLFVSDYSQNYMENNTVNGRPLIYLIGISDYSVKDAGQVILVKCNRIRVSNLDLSRANVGVELLSTNNSDISWNNIAANSYSGIYAFSSSNNSINGNSIADNTRGIWLERYSNYNNIGKNNITRNSIYGIQLYDDSNNNSIVENEIRNNLWGMRLNHSLFNEVGRNNIVNNNYGIALHHSSLGEIYHNNFINNTSQISVHDSMNSLDDNYPLGGNYWSDYNGVDLKNGQGQDVPGGDGIGDAQYVADAYNRDRYPLMKPYMAPIGIRDFAVLDLTSSISEVAYTDSSVSINVTVMNKGDRADHRTVTVYLGSRIIVSQTVTLAPSEKITLSLNWDISYTPPGNYTLRAIVGTVLAEANIADNALIEGTVRVKILGDVNGDNKVDIRDLAQAATAFGSYVGCPLWNPNTDLNNDGTTDIRDLVLVAKNFGKTYA